MGLYTNAAGLLGRQTFMALGAEDCGATGKLCPIGSTDPNYTAFMQALAPVSATPYYSFNVTTGTGLATFVVLADNSWDVGEQNWLESVLSQADANAKYTIIAKHYPLTGVQPTWAPSEIALIRNHKYSLLLTAHTDTYARDANDPSGRTVIMGTGGAPLVSSSGWYGFGTVTQGTDDRLTVTAYDVDGNVKDSFSVGPQ
jgi:hypothetical protein